MPAVLNGVVHIAPGRDHSGAHVFCVLVKRTYRITADAPAERCEDRPLRLIDEYYDNGDPEWSTVQYESEVAPYKPSTDVVVIGKAYAPRGVPTERMVVGVQVGGRRKTLTVTGNRHCHHRERSAPVFSDPEPFTDMEIRYDRAYGGRDEKSIPQIPFIYPRNFMGTGVVLRNVKEAVEGLPLPNVEDPQDLLTPDRLFIEEPDRWHLQPLPQGFGWRQRLQVPPIGSVVSRCRNGDCRRDDGAAAEGSCGARQGVAVEAVRDAFRQRGIVRPDVRGASR